MYSIIIVINLLLIEILSFFNNTMAINVHSSFETFNNELIDSILKAPSEDFINNDNDKKTDVSVIIYHHQAIHSNDSINKLNKNKLKGFYSNGYGLYYGYDLNGKYQHEKGYKFEKGMGREICNDHHCNSSNFNQNNDNNDNETPDIALKRQILKIIRHNNNNNNDNYIDNNVENSKNRKNYIENGENRKIFNLLNNHRRPFTKLDSLQVKTVPIQNDYNRIERKKNLKFYYPEFNNNNLYEWTNNNNNNNVNPSTNNINNNYHGIFHLNDRFSFRRNFSPIHHHHGRNDLQRELSEIKSSQIKQSPPISNNKIHNHWFIKTDLDIDSAFRDHQNRYNHMNNNEIQDLSTSNNYQNSILEPNVNPYSKKFIKFMRKQNFY